MMKRGDAAGADERLSWMRRVARRAGWLLLALGSLLGCHGSAPTPTPPALSTGSSFTCSDLATRKIRAWKGTVKVSFQGQAAWANNQREAAQGSASYQVRFSNDVFHG